jgi:transposase
MKAYSLDLRQKIVEAYHKGDISQRKLARQFGVATSFVQKLLKQARETGSLAPKVRTQQTPTKLNGSQLEVLRQLAEKNNDATLEELRQLLHERTQVLISVSTMDRMLRQKLNITVKKNALSQSQGKRASPASQS